MSDNTRTLDSLPPLAKGSHRSAEAGACMMEAAAYIAGEPWTDCPTCVCPAVASFARQLNDAMPDGLRDELLRPLVLLTIGTRGSADAQQRRAYIAADYAVHDAAPAALRAAGLRDEAAKLEALQAVDDPTSAYAATAAANAAYAAIWRGAADCLRRMCEVR